MPKTPKPNTFFLYETLVQFKLVATRSHTTSATPHDGGFGALNMRHAFLKQGPIWTSFDSYAPPKPVKVIVSTNVIITTGLHILLIADLLRSGTEIHLWSINGPVRINNIAEFVMQNQQILEESAEQVKKQLGEKNISPDEFTICDDLVKNSLFPRQGGYISELTNKNRERIDQQLRLRAQKSFGLPDTEASSAVFLLGNELVVPQIEITLPPDQVLACLVAESIKVDCTNCRNLGAVNK